jgi:hypothetical protein
MPVSLVLRQAVAYEEDIKIIPLPKSRGLDSGGLSKINTGCSSGTRKIDVERREWGEPM